MAVGQIIADACAKFILLGEHAVVYNQPALAFPIPDLRAQVRVVKRQESGMILTLVDHDETLCIDENNASHPLVYTILNTQQWLNIPLPNCHLFLESTIPVARGMGSGTAVTLAIVRALAKYCQRQMSPDEEHILVNDIENIYHGRSSGIDSAVITYERPIYFQRGLPITFLDIPQSFQIVIADTGTASFTRETVTDMLQYLKTAPEKIYPLLEYIGILTQQGWDAIGQGNWSLLGTQMNECQDVLKQLNLSCSSLECCIDAARKAGAYGAKLSGGGRGGICIALVSSENKNHVEKAMRAAGAVKTWAIEVCHGS